MPVNDGIVVAREVKDCLKDLKERIKRCKKEAKEEDGKKG